MPQKPVIIQQLPDIPDIEIQPPLDDDEVIPYTGDDPSGGAARGDVKVESQGVLINNPIGENAEISEKINKSSEQIDQSELVAEINEPQLLTPKPTPSPNAAQSSEIIHTPTRLINQQQIPGAWEDSPYIAISTNQRPQTPSENNKDKPLDSTADASLIRQYNDSPGRQLLTGMLNHMSLEPEEQPEPEANKLPLRPLKEIHRDFSTDNILHHKQVRKPKKNVYTLHVD
jgi:hypothetical protein